MTHLALQRTALYRLYDDTGRLLYIGITYRPEARWKAHAATKTWWPDVASKVTEWHATRLLAEAAEVAAIKAELPLYNVDDSPIAPRPRALDPSEITASSLKANFGSTIKRAGNGAMIRIVDRTRERRCQAAVVPVDLGELVQQVGGVDAAVAILKQHVPND
ncbi:GIY-YIG nuclease family protein [Streptomyces sp. NPDC059786]|uniref:GIY-YIG nuclease family protein n=1 Tax=Streptomyces sp. NPDC059786 TaxID=3346946 RepID=UPI00364A9F5A